MERVAAVGKLGRNRNAASDCLDPKFNHELKSEIYNLPIFNINKLYIRILNLCPTNIFMSKPNFIHLMEL
jgi:hypothetical protein